MTKMSMTATIAMIAMILNKLLPLVVWLAPSQLAATAFVPAPANGRGTTSTTSGRRTHESRHRNRYSSLDSLPKNKKSGFKSFSSSFPDPSKDESARPPPPPMKNDLSMFLAQEDDDDARGLSEELEFFVTRDESIQRLEEVEEFFRDNNNNNNNNDVVVAPETPERSGTVRMTDGNGIGVDEDSPSKKLVYYRYEGTLSKIRRNLCNNPSNEYSE